MPTKKDSYPWQSKVRKTSRYSLGKSDWKNITAAAAMNDRHLPCRMVLFVPENPNIKQPKIIFAERQNFLLFDVLKRYL